MTCPIHTHRTPHFHIQVTANSPQSANIYDAHISNSIVLMLKSFSWPKISVVYSYQQKHIMTNKGEGGVRSCPSRLSRLSGRELQFRCAPEYLHIYNILIFSIQYRGCQSIMLVHPSLLLGCTSLTTLYQDLFFCFFTFSVLWIWILHSIQPA